MKLMMKWALGLLSVLLVCVLAVGAFIGIRSLGWLKPLGIESESHDTQVITAVERTQEVSLLSLAVQGIKEEERNRTVFGVGVPGTGEKALVQYDFTAKLGFDGAKVEVRRTGKDSFAIAVPDFTFIGYDDPTFKTVDDHGGLLSGLTPDIDKVKMINEILDDRARQTYLDSNEALLEDQAKAFYTSLVTSIDPSAKLTFEFGSAPDDQTQAPQ